jgi:hypothetical protein
MLNNERLFYSESFIWYNDVFSEKSDDEIILFSIRAIYLLERKHPRIAHAMILRYGLDGGKLRTFSEVGRELYNNKTGEVGMTSSRARDIVHHGQRIISHHRQGKRLK